MAPWLDTKGLMISLTISLTHEFDMFVRMPDGGLSQCSRLVVIGGLLCAGVRCGVEVVVDTVWLGARESRNMAAYW